MVGHVDEIQENGHSVAIVGGGPAGLSAAFFLRKKGYEVTILEKESELGGMMRFGTVSYTHLATTPFKAWDGKYISFSKIIDV